MALHRRAAAPTALLLLVLTAGCGRSDAAPARGPAPTRAVSGRVPPPIDGAEAHRLVAEGAFLLDVRTPGEYAAGHAEGAVNIPVSELESRLGELPRDKTIISYCASGGRSRSAVALLRAEHFEVRDLRTLRAWQSAE